MDPTDVSAYNSFLVLDAIRAGDLVTRRELAKQLGLSTASVSRIVRGLLGAGSIEEVDGDGGELGRTPSLLRFVPRTGSVIAIDLGGTKCHGALADLGGAVLHEDYRPTGGAAKASATLVECLNALRSRAEAERIPVRAVVVGIPAFLDAETGLATAGPNVGWEGFDLLAILRQHVAEPVEVDNDANLAALGQAWRGQAVGARSFVTLAIGTGIGGGVVVDGRLVRGRHNAAGEIGHLPIGKDGTEKRDKSARADFEGVASGPAIRARASVLLAESPDSVLAGTEFDTRDVFAAAAADDPVGRRVIDELIEHVAMAIVSITALLDPALVVLDGSVGQALEPWLEPLERRVTELVFKAPAFAVSRLGPNATLVGAIGRGLALVSEQETPAVLHGHANAVAPSGRRNHRGDPGSA